MENKSLYDQGYEVGSKCNVRKAVPVPAGLSRLEQREWLKGFDAAISDRLS